MQVEPPARKENPDGAHRGGASTKPPCSMACSLDGAPAAEGFHAGRLSKSERALIRRREQRWASRIVIVLTAVCCVAALFVGVTILESSLLPKMSTGFRHALLTTEGALVAGLVSWVVFAVMRRQNQRLSDTAKRLTRLLEAFERDPNSCASFENPHLVTCHDLKACDREECRRRVTPGQRCWQALALYHPLRDASEASVSLRECQACPVYRLSCPDALTELGESINNLLYLLKQGAGQIGTLREEIAERRRMAAIGQIASGVAHEVCNPLSSISSDVQMLRRSGDQRCDPDRLDDIETHVGRISAVVRQLSHLAQAPAARFVSVAWAALLEDAIKRLTPDADAAGVRLEYSPAKELPATLGIPLLLSQCLLELGRNALEAMPRGGSLAFRTRAENKRIIIEVEDHGVGIPADVGRRIFEPFYTTKSPNRGSGMGLATVYRAVQEHGGTIEFAPATAGGTVFTMSFPVIAQAPGA